MEEKDELIQYLRNWKERTRYESVAMSEHRFSEFLDGLIDIFDPLSNRDIDND